MPEQQGPEQQGPEQQGPEQHGPEQRGTGTQWVAGSGGASLRNAFRNLADAIPQLAWIATPDGDIHWYNRRWYEYTGRSFAEMRGQGWRELHHPDHLERVVARFRAALETARSGRTPSRCAGMTAPIAGSCPVPCRCATRADGSSSGAAPTPT